MVYYHVKWTVAGPLSYTMPDEKTKPEKLYSHDIPKSVYIKATDSPALAIIKRFAGIRYVKRTVKNPYPTQIWTGEDAMFIFNNL